MLPIDMMTGKGPLPLGRFRVAAMSADFPPAAMVIVRVLPLRVAETVSCEWEG